MIWRFRPTCSLTLDLGRGALASLVWTSSALACSTVALGPVDQRIVAYSYDTSDTGAGFIIANPAGAVRRSIMEDRPARWAARHNSISFNQLGPGMPTVGMNAKGVVVSLMWNDDAVFPAPGGQPVVNELELIQMLLDRAGSVGQALALLDTVDVQALVPIHYFVADATGSTAAITPTRTGFVVHADEEMPVPALTNTGYRQLLEQLTGYVGHGGDRPMPSELDGPGSLERFVLASGASGGPATLDNAFAALALVENPQTFWQIVLDPHRMAIDFRLTGRDGVWRIDMDAVDFRCRDGAVGIDLAALPDERDSIEFNALTRSGLADVLVEVLLAFQDTVGLPPQMAGDIADAQLSSAVCR
ncbi:MAG: linear amide C-N hydrolase [Roseitalea sp.]|jgi:hypothetical protein|nr:linear amide C-N hydrolase [Roseitalea sp.]